MDHKHECLIYRYMCEKEQDLSMIYNLRLLIIRVHKAGGLVKPEKDMESVSLCKGNIFNDDWHFFSTSYFVASVTKNTFS